MLPSHRPVRRGALAVAFGVLGLVAGWAAADFFRIGAPSGEWLLRVALLVVAPLSAACVGGITARWLGSSWWRALAAMSAVTLGVGLVAGAWLGGLSEIIVGIRVHGAAGGVGAAALVLPAALVIFFAERRVGRARLGSVVDAMDRRGVAVAVAAAAVLGPVAAVPEWLVSAARPERTPPEGPETFAFLALVAIAVALVADLGALRTAIRSARELVQMSPRAPDAIERPHREVDLGLGDEHHEFAVRPFAAYRASVEVLAAIRGDAVLARRAAVRAVARDVAALVVGIAALTFAHVPRLAERLREAPPPPEAAVAPRRVEVPSTGIPECDAYVEELERFLSKQVMASDAKDTVTQVRDALKQAAAAQANRPMVVEACSKGRQSLHDAAR